MNIKTFIFDLGGVIIDLDESKTIKQLARLSGFGYDEILRMAQEEPLFKQYEMGLVSDAGFRAGLNQLFTMDIADDTLDKVWNAMLGELPLARLKLLNQLKQKYQVLVLSNTNSIHITAFNKILNRSSGENSLEAFADQIYFSHLLHLRKPDPNIFLKVLELSETKAGDALFLDDKLENLHAAKSVGIRTMHIESPNQIFELQQYING